jgi:P27 family predicted phage terminase small subunit
MGARGPKPKPSHIKLMEGTYRKDRVPKNEPRPKARAPSCPAWLSAEGKAEWKRQVGELSELGLLSTLDRGALTVVCEAWSDFMEASKLVDKHGRISVTDNGNVIQHPAVGMKNKAAQLYLKACSEFGMTPAARTRVEAAAPEKEEPGDEERFFGTA